MSIRMLICIQHIKFIIFLFGFSPLNMVPKWYHPPDDPFCDLSFQHGFLWWILFAQYFLVNTIYWHQVLFTTDVFPASMVYCRCLSCKYCLQTTLSFLACTIFCWRFFCVYYLLSMFFKQMLFTADIFVLWPF